MPPKTVLITGANRGIGLGIVKELLKIKEIEVIIAGARNVEQATDLKALSDPRLHIIPLDVSDDQSIKNSVSKTEGLVGENGLNLLINNAGVEIPYLTQDAPNRSIVSRVLDVNATGALLMAQNYLPLLRKAANNAPNQDLNNLSASRAAILNIGSDCCSQTLNVPGFCQPTLLAYKMSKAAMLSFARSLCADFETLGVPILMTTMHPGWVLTDMGGPDAEITIEESASKIVASIEKLSSEHKGGLFDRELNRMPF